MNFKHTSTNQPSPHSQDRAIHVLEKINIKYRAPLGQNGLGTIYLVMLHETTMPIQIFIQGIPARTVSREESAKGIERYALELMRSKLHR